MKTIELAKDIIFLCKKYGYEFNNTKIQKLLYLFVGFCLMNNIKDIYNIDEKPKLWPYGPVFPRVHKKFFVIKYTNQDTTTSIQDEKTRLILEKTVEKWGKISAGKLSAWSHIEDSPWDNLVKQGYEWNTEMDLEDIGDYFSLRVENVI